MGKPLQKEGQSHENPTVAKTEKSPPSERSSEISGTAIDRGTAKQADKKPYLPTHVVLSKIPGMKYDGESLFMLEQLRVIDKHRLRGYAGRLTKAQMELIDKAVCQPGAFPGRCMTRLTRQGNDRASLICLCPICRENFEITGTYRIRRANYRQTVKEICTYCQIRMGYDYYVTSAAERG